MAVPLIQAAPLDPQSAAASKPNFVMILADDLGNVDLGYRGSDIKTPNIDALAKDGVRLENFHGMPVCTPARAALMTGRYPMRQGLQTLGKTLFDPDFDIDDGGMPHLKAALPQP